MPSFTRSNRSSCIFAISYVEVLGYHQLTECDKQDFMDFFATIQIIPIHQEILEQAVKLRQQRNMSLGDSMIAATAIINDLTLITANGSDFKWIPNIRLLDPLAGIR